MSERDWLYFATITARNARHDAMADAECRYRHAQVLASTIEEHEAASRQYFLDISLADSEYNAVCRAAQENING